MSSVGPWSVKGIDSRAREIAKDQARRSGQTLGEWLNTRIIDPDAPDAAAAPAYAAEWDEPTRGEGSARPRPPVADPRLDALAGGREPARGWTERRTAPDPAAEDMRRVADAIGELSARIEGSERRSTIAISGIDQQVTGALTRLDAVDRTHTEAAVRLEDQLAEMRGAQARLGDRLRAMHEQDGPRVEAMKALEGALGKLAGQIHDDEARQRAAEAAARNVETELGGRLEALEQGAETVADAELVESRLSDLAARLEQAEARTGLAVRALETSFGGLDRRMADLRREPQAAEDALEARFAGLAEELSRRIEDSHARLIGMMRDLDGERLAPLEAQLRSVAAAVAASEKRAAQAIDHMGREVVRIAQGLGGRMAAAETRQAEVENRLGGEVSRIADAVEARLHRNDSAQADALERLGGEIARIAERLADRIAASETRAAQDAAELGEQLGRVSDTLRARQESTASELNRRLEASEARTVRLLAVAAPATPEPPAPAAPAPRPSIRLETPVATTPDEAMFEPAVRQPASWPSYAAAFLPAEPEPLSETRIVVEPAAAPAETAEPPAPEPEIARAASPPGADERRAAPEAFDPEPFVSGPFEATPERDESIAARPFEAPPPPRPATALPPTTSEAAQAPPSYAPPLYVPMAPVEEAAAAAIKSTSTRELIEAARAAARAAAETRKGRPAAAETPAPPPVAAPGFEPEAERGPSMTAPWRRKRQAGATLRTFMISSVVAGSVAATGTGAWMMYAGEGRRPTTGEAPTAAREPKPDADMLAMAIAPNSEVEVAPPAAPPPLAAPAALKQHAATAPKPAAPSAEAIFTAATAAIGRNEANGLSDLRHAANLGYAPAQFYLARLYEEGRAGAPKDLAEARRWTERAALQGDPHAMFNLGLFFANGDGGAKNAGTAVTWFERAARAGVRDAQYNLAVMNQNGEGVPRNAQEAYKWYLVASASGDAGAKAGADQVRTALNGEQRATAERAATVLDTRVAAAAGKPNAD